MAVVKEVYNLPIGFTVPDLCDVYRDAFIDAGYMASWYHSFSEAGRQHRVLEITYDGAKTYGKTYYLFTFPANNAEQGVGVTMGTGFNTGTNQFSGTQFVDYHIQPPSIETSNGWRATPVSTPTAPISNSQEFFLYRYTSTIDPTQSWFMSRVNTSYSTPFTILHPTTSIHPWLDMDRGPVSGFINAGCNIRGNGAACVFVIQNNIRRCVGIGSALSGFVETTFANLAYNTSGITTHAYVAPGIASAAVSPNLGNGTVNNNYAGGGHIVLPIGRSSINPAYPSDLTPICTNVPFSYYTNKIMAADFGIYAHYANNIQQPLDKFVTTPGVEEWEIVTRANNDTITTKASIAFLARVV